MDCSGVLVIHGKIFPTCLSFDITGVCGGMEGCRDRCGDP